MIVLLCEDRSEVTNMTVLASSSPPEPKADDFFPSLFRDSTGSHLAQAILKVAPTHIFEILWRLHFVGKIGKLASHPIGNFVVSTGVRRASEDQERRIIEELKAVDPSTLIREYLVCLQIVQNSSLNVPLLQRFCQNFRPSGTSLSCGHYRAPARGSFKRKRTSLAP